MNLKRLLPCLPALCLALGGQHAHAQLVSVYGLFSPTHVSHVQTGSTQASAGAAYQNQYTSFWAPAFGGGVTLNFANLHVVKLGLDARGSTKPGTTGADTAELALRVGVQPPVLRIKPYVQAGVGYLGTRTKNVSSTTNSFGAVTTVGGTFTNKYATVVVRGGVDTPLAPFFDWRVAEIGYGHAFNTGLGGGSTSSDSNLFSIATGIVFHF